MPNQVAMHSVSNATSQRTTCNVTRCDLQNSHCEVDSCETQLFKGLFSNYCQVSVQCGKQYSRPILHRNQTTQLFSSLFPV